MGKFIKVLICSIMLFMAHEGFSVDRPAPVVPPEAPQNIPIDGGLSWLLAAGGIYGVTKIRKNLNK